MLGVGWGGNFIFLSGDMAGLEDPIVYQEAIQILFS